MSHFGYTEFSDRIREAFIDKILYRLDCIYSDWLYGTYYDGDLLSCMMNDPEYTDLNDLFVELNIHFRHDLDARFYSISPFFWLDVRGMTKFPKRKSVDYRARTFSMHGPDGEVQRVPCGVARPVDFCPIPVALPVESVEHVPRRSTRAKKQREFYYGF